ncbi:4-hydroxythreonine-4-phosphate dehydrogenase PdxA [Glutamicibacter sp. JL.03c]|uniref:4-hydroxythreonine-4-phosphate dehydrogenase PdxA n=1 Tax=Glutamicibacter sp. JL.03c TaxID=2984842 RepID=UPI00299F8095|nr:4-hydroxythreonine-4-phosphate dehydrogenase PdxA [Glutamicibacter sp. JL.03c]
MTSTQMTNNHADFLILADDFSGACEVSLPWSEHGFSTRISLDDDGATSQNTHQAIVIDTNSRYLEPADAYHRIQALCHAQPAGTTIFKKIDSLWRGNLNAELAALARQGHTLIIAGALPHLNRTVANGRPLINGQPLSSTDAWQVEAAQAPETIAELLSDLEATSIPSPATLGPVENFAQRLALAASTHSAVIVDCATEADLQAIAATWLELRAENTPAFQHSILVGTGALNAALAGTLAATGAGTAGGRVPGQAEIDAGPRHILGVVGSASGPAGEQLGIAGKAGIPCGETAHELPSPAPGEPVILHATRTRTEPAAALAELRSQAAEFLLAHPDADLFLTGGETARAVLDDLGIRSLTPLKQLEPGVVICRTAHGRLVGSKPGSFGSPRILTHALATLRTLRAPLSQEPESMSTTTLDTRPFIAVTMGDGSGVGPEVTVGALVDANAYEISRPIVIGDCHRLALGAKALGLDVEIVEITEVSQAEFTPGRINVIDPHLLSDDLEWGKVSAEAGNAAYHYIRIACELGMRGEVQGICTAPLNKAALHEAGHIYPGHTELLAHFMGIEEVSMMLSTPKVKVIHVTTHIGLIDAIKKIEPGLVERTVRRGHEALVRAGNPNPKIGVCAINPHAGENGLFGYGEEEKKIIPALQQLQADGINAIGPLPADTAFFLAGRGDYDLIVAMYHDQGHGPVKVLGIEAGVNITVGLPVIRTSVDHGTAFDIAGKGIVEVGSMIEALQQSVNLASIPVK